MRTLISYGNEAYDYYEILGEKIRLDSIPVKNGIENDAGVEICYPEKPTLTVLMRKDEAVIIKKKIAKELTAPVEDGMSVGQIDYYVGEDLITSYPIITTEQVGIWDMEFCVKKLLNRFLFCYNIS